MSICVCLYVSTWSLFIMAGEGGFQREGWKPHSDCPYEMLWWGKSLTRWSATDPRVYHSWCWWLAGGRGWDLLMSYSDNPRYHRGPTDIDSTLFSPEDPSHKMERGTNSSPCQPWTGLSHRAALVSCVSAGESWRTIEFVVIRRLLQTGPRRTPAPFPRVHGSL